MPASSKSLLLTSSVAVFQPRIMTMRRAALACPSRSMAAAAVASSLGTSRGGRVTQRVMANRPPGARWRRYSAKASTVYR
ncbi:hypothetical protein D3C84_417650 [compost metagenome]